METQEINMTDAQVARALRSYLEGVKETRLGAKHDTGVGSPGTTGYVHGPGGLLRYPGVDPDVFSLILSTIPGIMNEIPAVPSIYINPMFEVVTGMGADSGSEAVNVCDNAPIGGTMTAGIVTAPFGKYQRSTRQVELNRTGQRNDRAEPMDLRLVGGPTGTTPFTDQGITGSPLVNEIDTVMFERALSFHRLLAKQVWRGNYANNTAGGGYAEMGGLDLMLGTSWKDAITGNQLAAMYPQVFDFNLARVDSNGTNLINALTYMMRNARDLAMREGVTPVRWAFAMRPGAFYEITKVWPCAYYTSICQISTSANSFQQVISLEAQANLRDDMRANRYLLIDGERVDVVMDDGILEFTNTTKSGITSGCFASDIYLIPFSILGGRAVTYLEYYQYQNPSVEAALGGNLALARVIEGGTYIETIRQLNWCLQWQAMISPRLIMRTPWLAGRLKNVQYCPLAQARQPFPDDPYFSAASGQTTQPGPSIFKPW